MGFAVLGDGIAYGDVSGDGHEEALISLFSGGTAGNLAVLLFAPGPDKPQLVATIPGYKIGGVMEAGLLKISQPQYAGFEPNCCASGLSSTNYQLTDGKLVTVSTTSEGFPEMRAPTVEKFYQFLNDKKYADAWPFLSPGYQKQQTFETWRAGYSATTSVEATDIRQRSNGTVSVLLKAAEATGKGQVAQKYHAVWSLVWDAKVGQWRLDTATVSIVTAKIAGKLQYPSSGIPALTIFAKNTDTGDIFTSETARNQSAWSITVPPGNYTVFAYLLESPNSTLAGGYSEFVKCGLKVGCPSHKLIPIKAESGKTTSGIDVSDWYAPAGAFPARP